MREYLSTGELMKRVGGRRANLMDNGLALLGKNYRKAVEQGVPQPILMSLDLADPGARKVARRVKPGFDPEAAQAREIRAGMLGAALHIAGPTGPTAGVIEDISPRAAAEVRKGPPDGYVWYLLVAEGRTFTMAIAVEDLVKDG
jgi:hypothetical protein